MKKIAIIGAGLSGLVLAEQLADCAEVTLFEKFHQVGGRMAVRSHPPYEFDHGAQFFTAKHPAFKAYIHRLLEAGVVAHWPARFVEVVGTHIQKARPWQADYPHYVGVPNMVAIAQWISAGLLQRHVHIHLNTRVAAITQHEQHQQRWCLSDDHQHVLGHYDWVVSTLPAEQTAKLMPASFAHHTMMNSLAMLPCYALMVGCEHSLKLSWDAAHVTHSLLSWISINSTKPERSATSQNQPQPHHHEPTSIVAMSRNLWAAEHFNQPDSWVIDHMLHTLAGIVGDEVLQAEHVHLKKWHFANAAKLAQPQLLVDAPQQLAACGDWCISGRVESAFMSASQLAQAIKANL